ncbi:MAG: universal stress protein [Bacillota bacterium]
MFNIKNIVVPTDFSKISNSAFLYAGSLAEQFNAKLHLIYIMDKTPPMLALQSLDVSEEQLMRSMEEQASVTLVEICENLQKSTEVSITPVLRKGLDYEEIINYADEINADLIVIATHGRTGILHTLLGSVAEKVIRYSKKPVLVVPPVEES